MKLATLMRQQPASHMQLQLQRMFHSMATPQQANPMKRPIP